MYDIFLTSIICGIQFGIRLNFVKQGNRFAKTEEKEDWDQKELKTWHCCCSKRRWPHTPCRIFVSSLMSSLVMFEQIIFSYEYLNGQIKGLVQAEKNLKVLTVHQMTYL